jgi:hypothetical protein
MLGVPAPSIFSTPESVSVPSLPPVATTKWPAPSSVMPEVLIVAVYAAVSIPLPPTIVSLPPRPESVSLPALPVSSSWPSDPEKVSPVVPAGFGSRTTLMTLLL